MTGAEPGLFPRGWRLASLLAALALVLVALLLPWYELGDYRPSGWQASAWIKLAVVLAALVALGSRMGAPRRLVTGAAVLALVCVALRVGLPPDFGFDFDELEVPVTRAVGAWLGLAAALAGAGAAVAAGRLRD